MRKRITITHEWAVDFTKDGLCGIGCNGIRRSDGGWCGIFRKNLKRAGVDIGTSNTPNQRYYQCDECSKAVGRGDA